MFSVLYCLEIQDIIRLQGCNKLCYEVIVPRLRPTWKVQVEKKFFIGLEEKLRAGKLWTEELQDTLRNMG